MMLLEPPGSFAHRMKLEREAMRKPGEEVSDDELAYRAYKKQLDLYDKHQRSKEKAIVFILIAFSLACALVFFLR